MVNGWIKYCFNGLINEFQLVEKVNEHFGKFEGYQNINIKTFSKLENNNFQKFVKKYFYLFRVF